MNAIISLNDVCLNFKKRIIFSDLSLEIMQPQIVGFVGENGSGKSVLFKLISGLYTPSKGNIKIRGVKLGKGNNDFPENLGILVDSPGFVSIYSGLRNLQQLANIQKKIDNDKIISFMEEFGLSPVNKTLVKNYSLGMKQKLGIIQAIMEDQDIIILDEPFNALDKKSVNILKDIILRLRKEGKTILLTSHNQQDLDELCESIYIIEDYKLNKIL